MSWWSLIVAWIANLFGARSGAATQRQADQTAALKQEVKVDEAVEKAQASAPTDRAGVSRELRRGDF